MNVTITIDNELCGQARQHALAKGKSLSGWLAGLVRKEVGKALSSVATTLLERREKKTKKRTPGFLRMPFEKTSLKTSDGRIRGVRRHHHHHRHHGDRHDHHHRRHRRHCGSHDVGRRIHHRRHLMGDLHGDGLR